MASAIVKASVAAAAVALAGYWYWSPLLTLHQMRAAAEARDADAFNDHVDYPRLRESLKGQFSSMMTKQLASRPEPDNDFAKAGAALGSVLGLAMVDRFVDALVRPEMVMRAMQEGRFQIKDNAASSDEARVIAADTDVNSLKRALKLYKLDNGQYPTNEQGLKALVERPTTGPVSPNWRALIERLPNDPWGNPYQYANPGNNGEIDVFYVRADGGPTTTGKGAGNEVEWTSERKGVDKYIAYATQPGDATGKRVGLVIERSGFAQWKLTEVRIPLED